jgi:hypothetical protein
MNGCAKPPPKDIDDYMVVCKKDESQQKSDLASVQDLNAQKEDGQINQN